ncbi:MAG: RAMP superfamily CRISPR-associated protein [Ktedonobacteraceae bacterium]
MQTDLLKIEYTLTFATPFHFGTGIRQGMIDRTVIRDDGGYLYMPGSTLKGVLRERCEQLERFYEDAQGTGKVRSPHDADAALLGLGRGNPTMITRIFGSQNRPGRLFFDDARQSETDLVQYESQSRSDDKGRYKELQVEVSTQVRMDRLTRTAVPGALYTSEYGTHDLAFQGEIQGWLECTAIATSGESAQQAVQPTYSLLLMLAGLHVIDAVGANKSSGKGRCTCKIKELAVNDLPVERPIWEAWFEQLDALATYGREG